jgi:DNA-binding LytR/AlgR family response regulator
MYSCVIVDDEAYAIESLKEYIMEIPNLEIRNTFTSSVDALKSLGNGDKIDLVLMDINMPEISGIQLSREIRAKIDKLIFTTAHTQYAFEAFDVDADAYLLKPYHLSKFISVIQKVLPNLFAEEETKVQSISSEEFFFVNSKEDKSKLIKVNYKDIVAIESKLNYIQIRTTSKNIFTYMTLGELAKKLSSRTYFIQAQRSFILNKDHIESIKGNTIIMFNNLSIKVGDSYKKNFIDFINQNAIKTKRNLKPEANSIE